MQLCSQFGNVASARVQIDKATGEAKGFGFVKFSTNAEAQAALGWCVGRTLGRFSVWADFILAWTASACCAPPPGTKCVCSTASDSGPTAGTGDHRPRGTLDHWSSRVVPAAGTGDPPLTPGTEPGFRRSEPAVHPRRPLGNGNYWRRSTYRARPPYWRPNRESNPPKTETVEDGSTHHPRLVLPASTARTVCKCALPTTTRGQEGRRVRQGRVLPTTTT